METETLL